MEMRYNKSSSELRQKIVFSLVMGSIFLVICGGLVYFIVSGKTSEVQEKKEVPSKKPTPVPPQPKSPSFPIDNIPTQRKHDWGGKRELNSQEEKTIIESLVSQ